MQNSLLLKCGQQSGSFAANEHIHERTSLPTWLYKLAHLAG